MPERAVRDAIQGGRAEDAWAAHEAAQRRAWLRTSYRQRLLWLEQTRRFAAVAIAAAQERRTRR